MRDSRSGSDNGGSGVHPPPQVDTPFSSPDLDVHSFTDWLREEISIANHLIVSNPTTSSFITSLLYDYTGSSAVFVPAGVYGAPLSVHEALGLIIREAPENSSLHFHNTRIPTSQRTLELFKDSVELFGGVTIADHYVWPNDPIFAEISEVNRYPLTFKQKSSPIEDTGSDRISIDTLVNYFDRYYSTETAQKYAQAIGVREAGGKMGRSATQVLRDDFWARGVSFPNWVHELVDLSVIQDFGIRREGTRQLLDERAFSLELCAHSMGFQPFIGGLKKLGSDMGWADIEETFGQLPSNPEDFVPLFIDDNGVFWEGMEGENGAELDIAVACVEGAPELVAEVLLQGRANVVAVIGGDGTMLFRSDNTFNRCGSVATHFGGRGHKNSGWAVVESLSACEEVDGYTRSAVANIITGIRSV